jgi:hypothetical protein
MKKTKVTFIAFDGTGALHLDFQLGPFGDATEANKGDGVGFFSASGELQGVTFDDVNEKKDHQVLEFDRYRIEASVENGKISHLITFLNTPKKHSRPPKKRTEDAA